MVRPGLYLISFLFLSGISFGDTNSLREKTREGLRKIRSYVPQSIIEAAHLDMQRGRMSSALRKLKYHQRLNPRDPEGYFLEGELFALTEKYREAYIAYHKAYYLTGSDLFREKMEEMKLKGGVSVSDGDEKGDISSQKDSSAAKQEESKEETAAPAEEFNPRKGSFIILSKLRTLNSLLKRYQSVHGELPKEFKLESLLEGNITTRALDISELGEVSIKDEKIFSSVYGTVQDQEGALKKYRDAISMEASGDLTGTLALLEGEIEKLSEEELDFLIRVAQRAGNTDKSLELRQIMAKKFPDHYANLFVLANYYFRRGEHQEALEYFGLLAQGNSNFKDEAQEKINLIRGGGSYRLREVFERQKEELGKTRSP